MTYRAGWMALLCAVLMFSTTACDDGGQAGDACESNEDCESESCVDGICIGCTSSSDCESGQVCMTSFPGGLCADPCSYSAGGRGEPTCEDEDYVCAQYGEAGAVCLLGCESDDDCSEAYQCTDDGYCRPACQSDDQCGAGRSCDEASGTCVSGSATAGESGAACTAATDCTAGVESQCAASADGWPGGYCISSCSDENGATCPSNGVCLTFTPGDDSTSFCMQECGSNFDCRAEYFCQPVGSTGFCMPRCNYSEVDFCSSSGLVCEPNSGACVEPSGGGTPPPSTESLDLGTVSVATNQEFGDFSFTAADDVASFAITVDADGGGISVPYRIVAPDGREVFNVERLMNSEMRILPYNDGSFAVLYPNSPRLSVQPGTWRFSLYNEGGGGSASVKVLFKRGPQAITEGRIDINAFIVTDAFGNDPENDSRFREMMDSFGTIWGAAGLQVGNVEVRMVTGADRDRYRVISDIQGPNSAYRTMIATLTRDVSNDGLNFFFVDEINAGQAGFTILGIAAGIPGIPVVQGTNTSGVAVSTVAIDPSMGLGGAAGLGQTMAHEGGHWLGLYHTTEQPGTLHDPLPDTVECSASRDRDNSGFVDAEECRGTGSQYLMFWEADLQAREISPNQAFVMLRNPAVK